MNKTCLKILASVVLASSALTAFAGHKTTGWHGMSLSNMQYGVTAMYDEMVDNFGIGFAAQNCMFEAGINGSIDHNRTTSDVNFTEYYTGAYLGFRRMFKHDFFGSVGAMGNYGFFSGDHDLAGSTHHPYTVGPYVGFEYQPKNYLQMFVRIMPYSYERNTVNLKEHEFFQEGQIGLTYFF